jgi:membrane-associated phospholipid phosphatase
MDDLIQIVRSAHSVCLKDLFLWQGRRNLESRTQISRAQNSTGFLLIFTLLITVAQLGFFSVSFAHSNNHVPLSRVFHNINKNFVHSFTYNYGLNHLTSIGLTWGMVKGGVDWEIRKLSSRNLFIQYAGLPSVILGGLTPIILPISLYFYGRWERDSQIQNTALALGQAAILSLTISTIYKAVTGRKGPSAFESDGNLPNYSKDFNFGFFRRGVFDGWPSGHTTTAFAMATTLIELYPDEANLKYVAMAYATFIGVGVAVNIHWASDAVAGFLMGYAIGRTVGREFSGKTVDNNNLVIVPGLSGIRVSWTF